MFAPLSTLGGSDRTLVDTLIEVTHLSPVPRPDTRSVVRPGWHQRITPSETQRRSLNEVVSSGPIADVDTTVADVLATYRGHNMRWSVMPGTQPEDVGRRLAEHGLVGHSYRAMAAVPSGARLDLPGTTVAAVDAGNVDAWAAVTAGGWGGPLEPFRQMYADAPPTHRFFLASVDGTPAATGAMALSERAALLIGGVVMPEFRGRGLYRALVAARASAARHAGCRVVTTHALEDTSAPILERLGFETVFRYATYVDP